MRRVPFGAYRVPVVPLEIQLGTNFRRGLRDRIDATAALLRQRGYDQALVERSLPAEHLGAFRLLMRASAD